ncbi:hypothetical protein [Ktedonospora formicarum]|uniref:Uncharacterized protein n=1 Tax=Ktedonospora formicarum TaxID=2778364 RepID=A0A8J3I2S3_9CHLR|nr:hypothetical protein [Ktedonospora formicarum]GHO45653.1 hypothetical protein KSX_38160 [Ktedonospora formicarum]
MEHSSPPIQNGKPKRSRAASLYLKCAAFLTLTVFSVLIIACGADPNSISANTQPQVTVTFDVNSIHKQSTGTTTPNHWCGAWVTQTSPAYSGDPQQKTLGINGTFTKNNGGNPQGMAGATATAIIHWGDGSQDTLTGTTSSDGLVVLAASTAGHEGAIGKTSIVTVTFTGADGSTCQVDQDRAAFFSLAKATATPKPSPSPSPTKPTPPWKKTPTITVPPTCPTMIPGITPPPSC